MSCLGRANVSALHENPNRMHTELTFFYHYNALSQKVCFCRPLKCLKPDRQTVWTQIRLVWSGSTMFASMLMLNRHFQMQLFCWRFKD